MQNGPMPNFFYESILNRLLSNNNSEDLFSHDLKERSSLPGLRKEKMTNCMESVVYSINYISYQ